MNYRYAVILDEKTLSASGTEVIDLNVKEPISRISLRTEVLTGTADMAAQTAADVTKIELVDGSDVLHSLTGYENQALCIYDRKAPTMWNGDHYMGGTRETFYGIDFGRKLWDKELAFDPKRFSNPQLKVTYNRTLADAAATAIRLEVFAWLFDEKIISPLGFLMSKEHFSYTIGADGSYQYIDLPTDYPYRKMLVRGYYATREPYYALESLRLDEDNLKRIPFDVNLDEYYWEMKQIWTPISERIHCSVGGQPSYVFVTPTDVCSAPFNVLEASTVGYQQGYIRGGRIPFNAAGAGKEWHGWAHGYLPNHCWEFPLGDPMDMDDWYDVTKVGSLRLRLEAGSGAGTTGSVVLQQLRRY